MEVQWENHRRKSEVIIATFDAWPTARVRMLEAAQLVGLRAVVISRGIVQRHPCHDWNQWRGVYREVQGLVPQPLQNILPFIFKLVVIVIAMPRTDQSRHGRWQGGRRDCDGRGAWRQAGVLRISGEARPSHDTLDPQRAHQVRSTAACRF